MSHPLVSFKTKLFIGILVLFASLVMVNVNTVFASTTSSLPGSVEGEGTHFDITNSAYLNISLTSSEIVKAYIESIPEMITIGFGVSESATSANISINGLLPLATYYKYQDDYHNLQVFTTDENGAYDYVQDLSERHVVFIQTIRSTRFINNDLNGGDCSNIGIWDKETLTCTLSQDVNETIQINANNITLDGDGHTINGSYTGNGIYVIYSGVTIKNLTVQHFTSGIAAFFANNTRLENVTVIANSTGFNIRSATNTVVVKNNLTNNSNYGIFIGWYYAGSPSTNTQVYNNNFERNAADFNIGPSEGTLLSLDPPIGGNYFDRYDSSAEGCVDANTDGMCDGGWNVGVGYYDNHPWTLRNGWIVSDTRKLIKVGVVLMESADTPHNSSRFPARPCKLPETPTKNYESGHSKAYFNDLIVCIKDYYKENLYDTVNLDFSFIGGGQWYVGSRNEQYYATHSADLFNDAISLSSLDKTNFDVILVLHSGDSLNKLNGVQNKIPTEITFSPTDIPKIKIAENDGLGPWVHELGHLIGSVISPSKSYIPDLYHNGLLKNEKGVEIGPAQWDVMSMGYTNGGWDDPSSMSSWTRSFLGVLGEDMYPKTDERIHPIQSLESSKLNDKILRYDMGFDGSNHEYYLIELRDHNPSIGQWESKASNLLPDRSTLMYRVEKSDNGDLVSLTITNLSPSVSDSRVLIPDDTYKDGNNLVTITAQDQQSIGDDSVQVAMKPILAGDFVTKMIGAVMLPGNVMSRGINAIIGDMSIADPSIDFSENGLDLHAYCSGGKHIGLNYETGEFDNQIPGSFFGGRGGAPEWIYVPSDVIGCRFFVSSERNSKFLSERSEIASQLASTNDEYNLYARYIDPATGIFTSSVQADQVIQPGVMMKHEVSGTTEIAVTPGVVGAPNEPPPLFCPLLTQSVTYSTMSPAPACTFTNGSKTLQLKDSSCNPIAGARVNVRKANGAYLTYALTDANGLADLSGYANPDASYFELDYHGATYSTASGTFSSGIGVQTHPYELSLKGSDCAPIAGARVNLRKANDAYVTYALTNADGKASFEVVPNASMKLESDYRGGTWISESREPDTTITLGTDKYSLVLKDNAGTTISNARINLRKQNNAYVTYAMTNESGVASFEVLPNVPMVFEVDYNGATYQTAASATHEETQISTIPFGMRFLDSNGTPVSGARINLRKSNDAYVTYALTNTDGTALFQVVPGAQMKLEVDYHGYTYLTNVLAADTTSLTNVSTNVLALELKDSAGGVLPGVRVNLRKANSSYVTYAITNESGVASFEVVPGAQMRLEADYHGGTYQTEVATVTNNTTLQVQTSPITVHLTAQGNLLVNKRTDLLKSNGAYVMYGTTNAAGDVFFEVLPNTLNKIRATYNGNTWISDVITGGSEITNNF